MSNYKLLGLYDHNIESYEKIVESFEKENIVGIVHATGTGKSYNALQLALDNKDKKIIYITPSNGIIEHLKKIINDNQNLDLKRDFPNLEFRTYQSLINLSKEELSNLPCELLILDEFHHLGAPVWGSRINTLIETHENIKVLGMTAYTIRDRNTPYERDMANPDTNELFSNKIVSRYDLCDAMIDGLLPKPIYKTAYTNLLEIEEHLESKINKLSQESTEYKEYTLILRNIKRRINDAPSIPNILKKTLKPNGKYIYFCPPFSEEGTNDIETIKSQTLEYLKIFTEEKDIEIYTTTSDMGELGQKNRDAFYNDKDLKGQDTKNKLRIMFAINQYNEGVHAPNIDGVIMGRGTSSDIVFFEQLGRALAVNRNNNPVIIDLAGNYTYMNELENNIKDRIKEQSEKTGRTNKRKNIPEVKFNIEIQNIDIFNFLSDYYKRINRTWNDYYELARKYYETHGDLEITREFQTNDGVNYDLNGKINLGRWITNQRQRCLPESERGKLLLEIGMRFKRIRFSLPWNEMYIYAKKYYETHGDLEVPAKFKTNDGATYDPNGKINLGQWIRSQRHLCHPESERGKLLFQIGMRFENIISTLSWKEMYEYAKKYYGAYGNLEIPQKFKTNDGTTYDSNGKINLGKWISNQRQKCSPKSEQGKLLLQIGMRFECIKAKSTLPWNEMYEYVKKYYEAYGNLEIPQKFKTNDGVTYDPNGKLNLGEWIGTQRKKCLPESERGKLLSQIGMRFENKKSTLPWKEMYEYAKKYYELHGNLEIPATFKTNDGKNYDNNGKINLGRWIDTQRQKCLPESEQGKLLLQIGMRFNLLKDFNQIKNICLERKIDTELNKQVTHVSALKEFITKIKLSEELGINLTDENGKLNQIFYINDEEFKDKFGYSVEELISKYNLDDKSKLR